jgi:hypothetical protein
MKIRKSKGTGVVRFRLDDMPEDEKEELLDGFTEQTGITRFKGRIKHAYSFEKLRNEDHCPLCASGTKRYYADFIYATDIAPRVMYSPAFFCINCPTVIINEALIIDGITGGFKYQGVLGIDYGKVQRPDLLETWNGEKTVYVLDEDHTPIGIATGLEPEKIDLKPEVKDPSGNRIKKSKKRKQLAARSRKKNRKKK